MSALNLRLHTLEVMLYLVGVRELPGNRGATVGAFQAAAGIRPGDPWCAAVINWAAERAAARLGVRSPLELVPLQGYVPSYVQTFPAVPVADALPGDLLALWSERMGRHAHIAVAESFIGRRARTVEGNTNEAGSREGVAVLRRSRELEPLDVVLRWTRTVERV